jgi:hypothetical protein
MKFALCITATIDAEGPEAAARQLREYIKGDEPVEIEAIPVEPETEEFLFTLCKRYEL